MEPAKIFEIHYEGQILAVIARIAEGDLESDRWLLGRPDLTSAIRFVLLARLEGGEVCFKPSDWSDGASVMPFVQGYLQDNWETLESGAVIDVSLLLKQ